MTERFFYPTVFIDRAILNSGTSVDNYNCELLLNLKAPVGGETITTLQNDSLTVKVLEVRDEKLASILDKSSELVQGMIENNNFSPNLFFINFAKNLKIIDSQAGVEEFRDFFNRNTRVHSIANDEIRGNQSVNRIKKDSEGESVLNVYVRKHIKQIQKTPHLSFYVYSIFDKNKVLENNGFAITDEEAQKNIKITAEVIINKSKIASETFVYFRKDDSVWTEEVHLDQGIWYSGKYSEKDLLDEDGRPLREELTRRSFYNTKIQDFRSVYRIEKRMNADTDVIRRIENFEIVNDSFLVRNEDSPFRMLQDNSGIRCHTEDLLWKHSSLYRTIRNFSLDLSAWANSIKFRVYRKRVRLDNSGLNNVLFDFSNNEPKQYIFYQKSVEQNGTIEIKFTDFGIEDDEGSYCYGIEAVFDDPVSNFMETLIEDSEREEKRLTEYYERCKILSYTNERGNFFQGNYDRELNMFTEKFIEEMRADDERQKLSRIINQFRVMSLSIVPFGTERFAELARMVAPETGTPDGVLSFLKIYRTIFDKLQKKYFSLKNATLYSEEKYFNKSSQKRTGRKSAIATTTNRFSPSTLNGPTQNSLLKTVKDLSDLCSLTIKKTSDSTRVDDPRTTPAGGTNSDVLRDFSFAMNAILLDLPPQVSDSNTTNPFSSRKIIGNAVISTPSFDNSSIDFSNFIANSGISREQESNSMESVPTTLENTLNTKVLIGESSPRIPSKVAQIKSSDGDNLIKGLNSTPKTNASKNVSSENMEQVLQNQVLIYNQAKKRIR